MRKRYTSKQKKRDSTELFSKADAAWDAGDLPLAFRLFLDAAAMGDAWSEVSVGLFHDYGLHVEQNRMKAVRWYKKAYRQGLAEAATNIAVAYRDMGDLSKMIWWLRRAVALGDNDAALDLGKCYEKGLGVPKNLNTGLNCYKRVLASDNATEASREQAQRGLQRIRPASKA